MKKIILCILTICCTQAIATTHSVTTLTDTGAGSIRDLIASANPGDTIEFSVSGTITLTAGQITLSQDLVILSSGPANIALNGNNANRIFDITGGKIYIEALSFENGVAASSSGGAIRNASADTLTLVNCIFNTCSAPFDGGAIVTDGAVVNISNCTFTNNHANFDGGGIRINDGMVSINGSTFNGNTTGFAGAALRNVGPIMCNVTNTTLSGNTANGNGGGFEGSFNLINCTITGNMANNGGGAKPDNSIFRNCIVYNNTATGVGPDFDGSINSNGNNIIGDVSGSGGFSTSDLLGIDPLLDVLGLNGGFTSTHALMSNSPAIDAGHCQDAPKEDQRGNARIGYPDIGAYEFGGTPFVTNPVSMQICAGDTLVFGLQMLDTAGVYTEVFQSSEACDSTVELTLTVNPVYNETTSQTICDGDSISFGTQTLNATGVYSETFTSSLSCDSIVEMTLTVISPDLGITQNGKALTSSATSVSYQWLDCLTNQIIPNDTNQVFTATANGDYAVIITDNGCADTSACFTVINVGISKDDITNFVSVYPTKFSEEINLKFNSLHSLITLKIIDVQGKEILNREYHNTEYLQLNLTSLSEGNYFIQIETEGNTSIQRIFKSN